MRHLLVGATLLVIALAATFGLASVLQSYAISADRAPVPIAGEPDETPDRNPANKPPTGEQKRSPTMRRAGL